MIDKSKSYVVLNSVPYLILLKSCCVQAGIDFSDLPAKGSLLDIAEIGTSYLDTVQPAYVVFGYLDEDTKYESFRQNLFTSKVIGLYDWKRSYCFTEPTISEQRILTLDGSSHVGSLVLSTDYSQIIYTNQSNKYPSNKDVSDILNTIYSRQQQPPS